IKYRTPAARTVVRQRLSGRNEDMVVDQLTTAYDPLACEPGEQADNQCKAAEELGTDGKECQGRGNAQLEKRARGDVQAEPPEPAQHLLGAVDEKGHPQYQARDREGQVVGGGEHSTKHGRLPQQPLRSESHNGKYFSCSVVILLDSPFNRY